jgi:hypothetical protein
MRGSTGDASVVLGVEVDLGVTWELSRETDYHGID